MERACLLVSGGIRFKSHLADEEIEFSGLLSQKSTQSISHTKIFLHNLSPFSLVSFKEYKTRMSHLNLCIHFFSKEENDREQFGTI